MDVTAKTGLPEGARSNNRLSSHRPWYIVGLLATLYAMSFIDRFILALLGHFVTAELGIDDVELGLLIGVGFAITYSLCGLPLALLIDRGNRPRIVALGVLIWSFATIASAFASNLWILAVARAGVAVGEAVLTPAAVSFIADLFPRERRALPTSIYSSISGFMSTGAFVVGAAALSLATVFASYIGLAPWRMSFIIVGLPGILLAVLLLATVKDPPRSVHIAPAPLRDRPQEPDEIGIVPYFLRNLPFYLPLYLGIGLFAVCSFALLSWMPTILIREHGFDAAKAGYLIGAIGIPSGLIGTFVWPLLAVRVDRRRPGQGTIVSMVMSVLLAVPFLVLAPQITHDALILVVMAAAIFGLAGAGVLPPLAAQNYGPQRFRARFAAMAILAINLIGFTIGPAAVPLIARSAESGSPLGFGLSITAAIAGSGAFVSYLLSWRSLRGREHLIA